MQLADLGADVIKIERLDVGDPFRNFGTAHGMKNFSHNFCAFNRNKRSVTLDFTQPEGQEIFRKLATTADVIVENNRPGVLERYGLGYEQLKPLNPRLIYCSITGFSTDGPYRNRPAFDTVGQALSGMLGLFAEPEDPRMRGPTITDQISGMQACYGVLGALLQREKTGVGARVEIAMVDATMYHMPDSFTAYTQAGVVMKPQTRAAFSLTFAFTCQDDRMVGIQVSSTEKFWQAFLAATEQHWIGEDPRFADRPSRIKNFEELTLAFRPAFRTRTQVEWVKRLSEFGVPAAEILTVPEAMGDPEVRHLGLFHEEEHPTRGKLTVMHRAVRIDGKREDDPLLPPELGEHTEEVLSKLGIGSDAIAGLRDRRII